MDDRPSLRKKISEPDDFATYDVKKSDRSGASRPQTDYRLGAEDDRDGPRYSNRRYWELDNTTK